MEAMGRGDRAEADAQKTIRDKCEAELFAKALVYRRNAASIQSKRRQKDDEAGTAETTN
jgi:hypothetical protein